MISCCSTTRSSTSSSATCPEGRASVVVHGCHADALPIVGRARDIAWRLLTKLNRDLCVDNASSLFVTVFCARKSGPARWCSPTRATIPRIM